MASTVWMRLRRNGGNVLATEPGRYADNSRRVIRGAFALVLAALAAPVVGRAQGHCPRADLPAYAHNDYANRRPLADALALGYRGAEADVFLVGGVLRLGHDRPGARRGGALESHYVAPLHQLVARCGTLTPDRAPFLLAVELKEESRASYDSLVALLARYPALFPAVEVVLVGWHPAPAVLTGAGIPLGRQYRLGRRRADPSARLGEGVRLVSLDYGKTLGRWWVRAAGRRRWLEALRAAKAAHPNRRLRVHNVPVNRSVYQALRDAGVDLIGTKHLTATAAILRDGRGR